MPSHVALGSNFFGAQRTLFGVFSKVDALNVQRPLVVGQEVFDTHRAIEFAFGLMNTCFVAFQVSLRVVAECAHVALEGLQFLWLRNNHCVGKIQRCHVLGLSDCSKARSWPPLARRCVGFLFVWRSQVAIFVCKFFVHRQGVVCQEARAADVAQY